MNSWIQAVERAATAGATVAKSHFDSDLTVDTKSDKTDVLTVADRSAQKRVIDELRKQFTEEPIVAEEGELQKNPIRRGPALWSILSTVLTISFGLSHYGRRVWLVLRMGSAWQHQPSPHSVSEPSSLTNVTRVGTEILSLLVTVPTRNCATSFRHCGGTTTTETNTVVSVRVSPVGLPT